MPIGLDIFFYLELCDYNEERESTKHFHYVVSVKTKTKIVRSLAPAHAGHEHGKRFDRFE